MSQVGWEQSQSPGEEVTQTAVQAGHTFLAGARWAGKLSCKPRCMSGLVRSWEHRAPRAHSSAPDTWRQQLRSSLAPPAAGSGGRSSACLAQDHLRDRSRLRLGVRPRAPGGEAEGSEIMSPSFGSLGKPGHPMAGHVSAHTGSEARDSNTKCHPRGVTVATFPPGPVG